MKRKPCLLEGQPVEIQKLFLRVMKPAFSFATETVEGSEAYDKMVEAITSSDHIVPEGIE